MVSDMMLLPAMMLLVAGGADTLSLPDTLNPNNCPESFKEHPVILVSLDGFRADYLARGLTPNINSLGDAGVRAPYMKPSFPSSTFPNHYTIVTGLMPAYHGIVHNRFYDPTFKEEYHRGSYESLDIKWWGGEPIWRTAMKYGKIAASYFWVGSEVRGLEPTPGYWYKFNLSIPFRTRVEKVLEWIDLPVDKRPSIMTLYLHEPDRQGHKFGPNSKQVDQALEEVDVEIGRLISGLQERGLLDCVNVLLVADHGMAESGPTRVVEIKDYIPNITNTTRYWDGIFARFTVDESCGNTTLSYMEQLACKSPEMRVYHKRQLPVRWHMSAQPRVEDVVLDMDEGFQAAIKPTYESDAGDHGYDNYFSVMNAMFVGHGPDLKRGIEVEAFQNIELYNLMCQLLHIPPAPNNGTWGALHHFFINPPAPPQNIVESLPAVLALPKDTEGYNSILEATKCITVPDLYNEIIYQLYEAQVNGARYLANHLPWGSPQHRDLFDTVNIIVGPDHITGYSTILNQPLWTSFSMVGERPIRKDNDSVWLIDFRLPVQYGNKVCDSHHFLQNYELKWKPLFHPQFSSSKKLNQLPWMVSNAIPMSEELSGRWRSLRMLIAEWLKRYKTLHVVMGPVFDFDSDTFVDDIVKKGAGSQLAVPTHLFIVVSRCQTHVSHIRMCPSNKIDVLSFILPQSLIVSNCLDGRRFANEFSAKLQDVEKITGLSLFPYLPYHDRITLQTRIHSNVWGYETWANRIKSDLFGFKKKK